MNIGVNQRRDGINLNLKADFSFDLEISDIIPPNYLDCTSYFKILGGFY